MKLWLAAAVLLALLALVVARQRHGNSAENPPQTQTPSELPPGWGSVVLGAPSAALPAAPAAAIEQPAPTAAAPPAPAPPTTHEFELVVSPGQSLSMICKEHYGTASVALVEALARFNQLASSDAVRAGQKLRLPPLETLQKP